MKVLEKKGAYSLGASWTIPTEPRSIQVFDFAFRFEITSSTSLIHEAQNHAFI
jgi:hypothetical protein